MRHPDRRTLTLGALGLAAGGIGVRLVTADHIDYSAAERERITAELDAVAEQWESLSPTTLRVRLYAIHDRMQTVAASGGSGDWAALAAQNMIMMAQAEADSGQADTAIATARHAWGVALEAGVTGYEAHASVITAEIQAERAPADRGPVRLLQVARHRAGVTAVGAQAGALEAHARATRGEDPALVRQILTETQRVQSALPAAAGWPRWTPAHLYAYGGLAAVRSGQIGMGAEWLAHARALAAGQPGIASAATVYSAHGYAAGDQWDGALQATRDALAVSGPRGVPAWLASNARTLARQAKGRGGDWSPVEAVIAA